MNMHEIYEVGRYIENEKKERLHRAKAKREMQAPGYLRDGAGTTGSGLEFT